MSMGRNVTHYAVGLCMNASVRHGRNRACGLCACGSTKGIMVTHDWKHVSCKRCNLRKPEYQALQSSP